jgi:CRP/FNR family transcriptional regulator, cyclic AMP receptor protein
MGLFDYAGAPAKTPHIDEITLLADISSDDWSRILKLVETRQFRAGEDLIRVGDKDDSFYILTVGEVNVVIGGTEDETVLATIGEGSVFGEIAFFDGEPRSATIRAKTQGTAVRVTRESFDTLAAWEPAIARQLLFDLGSILSMRLRWTTSLNAG